MKKILVIDNYDSFVYNIVQILCEDKSAPQVDVVRNTDIPFDTLCSYDGIVLSPGPSVPSQAGELNRAIACVLANRQPVLGICLGHQALAEAFGAKLQQMPAPLHGHRSTLRIIDSDDLLFRGMTSAKVGRYHSWVVAHEDFPPQLRISSLDESGLIMSFYHPTLPVHGVQFHPESIITERGEEMIRRWIESL